MVERASGPNLCFKFKMEDPRLSVSKVLEEHLATEEKTDLKDCRTKH